MTALPPGFDPKTTAAEETIAIGDTEPSASADGNESQAQDASGKNTPPHDLKGRTMRGALVSTAGQGANFFGSPSSLDWASFSMEQPHSIERCSSAECALRL
jgi:hypothetical protein